MKNIFYFMCGMLILTVFSLVYLKVSFAGNFDDEKDFEDFWDEEVFNDEEAGDEGLNLENGDQVLDYGGIVRMEAEFLDGDILRVAVLAEEMQTPVLGLAFNLIFKKDNLAFLKYQPGDFLESGGDPFYLVTNNESKIVFGETLRRNDDFPVGEGKVADFYFQIIERKGLEFSFENGVVSTMDIVRQDIEKIVWENLSIDKTGEKIGGRVATNVSAVGGETFSLFNFGLGFAIGMALIGAIFLFFYLVRGRGRNIKRDGHFIHFVEEN